MSRVGHCGGMPVLEFFLSHPAVTGIAAFLYIALIWWMLGVFSRAGDE